LLGGQKRGEVAMEDEVTPPLDSGRRRGGAGLAAKLRVLEVV
jgi:hypothetical protein